jgi:hypothetical protein
LAEFVELTIEQGATFLTEVLISDANGNIKDLSGYEVRSQLRKSYYSSSSVEFQINIVDPANGIVTMEISAANTSNISPGRYVYDMVLANTIQNSVMRIFEGIVTVMPGVTK